MEKEQFIERITGLVAQIGDRELKIIERILRASVPSNPGDKKVHLLNVRYAIAKTGEKVSWPTENFLDFLDSNRTTTSLWNEVAMTLAVQLKGE